MKYDINIKAWGRRFSVPCSVVDAHMKLASGAFLKVILYILSAGSPEMTSAEIAAACGIDEREADDAVLFWCAKKVITVDGSTADDSIAVPKNPVSAAAEPERAFPATDEPMQSIPAADPAAHTLQKKTHLKLSPQDIEAMTHKDKDLKYLFDSIQVILKRPINFTEESGLITLRDYYGFSAPSILMLVEYCEQIGKSRLAYIEAVAKGWFESGITAFADIEREIIRLTAQHTFERQVAKSIGLETALTAKQRAYFAQWQDWDFDTEMIAAAYEKCVDQTNKLSLPYMNKILERWHSAGISTPAQALAEEAPKNKFRGKNAPAEKEHSYDLDEFNDFAMNYKPQLK
ncbi:MAG: DnaD domain protein [Oscillospiraceae bacterium]